VVCPVLGGWREGIETARSDVELVMAGFEWPPDALGTVLAGWRGEMARFACESAGSRVCCCCNGRTVKVGRVTTMTDVRVIIGSVVGGIAVGATEYVLSVYWPHKGQSVVVAPSSTPVYVMRASCVGTPPALEKNS
jgi:hypothetical protein